METLIGYIIYELDPRFEHRAGLGSPFNDADQRHRKFCVTDPLV
jgi:hypothetical protein